MSRTLIDLPVGTHPSWELEDEPSTEEKVSLHTVFESSVLFQSLRQSREKWLTSTFPRFSAKSRGGRPPVTQPPPHTIKGHGKFDLSIGPHTFSNTAIYEVHYLPQVPAQPVSTPSAPGPSTATPAAVSATGPLIPQPQPQPVTAPPSEAIVTPTLISQVNAAAESNPILSKLLHTAAAGRATPEEIKTLGILIRSVGIGVDPAPPALPPASPAPSQVPEPAPLIPPEPVKEFDLVIEFQERLSDKWVFPRGLVSFEVEQPNSSLPSRFDLLMNVALPFPAASSSLATEKAAQPESIPAQEPSRVVAFRWTAVHQGVHELLMKWAGGERKIAQNRQVLDDLRNRAPKRSFLQYQLPDGPLLTQIQAMVAPCCPTKSIKPSQSDGSRVRRRPTIRKPPPEKPPVEKPTPEKPTTPIEPTEATPSPPKRKRPTKPKTINPLPPIACHYCGQTDVPLMMGGRYCRPCIEQGKAVSDIPSATPIRKQEQAPQASQPSQPPQPSVPLPVPAPESRPPLFPPSRRVSVLSMPLSRSPLAINPPIVHHPEGEKKS